MLLEEADVGRGPELRILLGGLAPHLLRPVIPKVVLQFLGTALAAIAGR